MAPYLLISGKLDKTLHNVLVAIDNDRKELQAFATRYAKDNPGIELHIFEWDVGIKSRISVEADTLYASGYEQPLIPEVQEPPTVGVLIDPTN